MTSGSASMTMTPITTEPQGISIAPGDHICAFYRGNAQREEVLLPFLRDGIRAGDKCIAVMDDPEFRRVLEPLSTSLDVEASLSARQLDLLCSDSAYLAGGSFLLERMLDFWELGVGGALRSGFTFVRAVGEMTWALRDLPGVEDLVRYDPLPVRPGALHRRPGADGAATHPPEGAVVRPAARESLVHRA
jgi:hypothetical protein